MRFTAGPAKIAVSLRHVAWRQYASGASDHSSSCHARVVAEHRPELLERSSARAPVVVHDRVVEPRELGAVLLAILGPQRRREVARRRAVHPGDLHVAAERDRADAVLDAAAVVFAIGGPKPR